MRKPVLGIYIDVDADVLYEDSALLMKLCYAYGIDIVYFTKVDIDFEDESVNARVWTPDGFVRERVRVPEYLEAYGPKPETKMWLAERTCIIDDYRLSKKEVDELLIASELATCVIPTVYTSKADNILTFASVWSNVIIKPFIGARGEGIHTLAYRGDSYVLTDTKNSTRTLGAKEVASCLEELYHKSTVIVQPVMKFLNKDGKLMDFRINVQKDGKGQWSTVFILPRTSRDSIVSNISAGGYASSLKETLSLDYGENAQQVHEALKNIASKVPPMIEEASGCHMLALGIDVGIDRDTLNPYIIEVNHIPQVHYFKSDYISQKAEYFLYIYKNANK